MGGFITGNEASLGIAAIYGADTSRSLNLLGGEISGNTTGATSASTGAIYAFNFGTITLGGPMVIRNNFKGTAASTSFGDLQIGTKTIQVNQDFTGEVYIHSDNHYQFGNVFGTLGEGFSISGGHFYNNRNPYLHGEKDSLNQILWDYSYNTPSVHTAPTSSTNGFLRQYAYVDSSGIPSTTIYRDITLPALNPIDYTVTFDEITENVTYVWKNTDYGTYSFEISFADCDLVSAKDIAKDAYATLLASSPSQAILDIVNTAKTQIDSALTVAAIIDILSDTDVLIINQKVLEAQQFVEDTLWTYLWS